MTTFSTDRPQAARSGNHPFHSALGTSVTAPGADAVPNKYNTPKTTSRLHDLWLFQGDDETGSLLLAVPGAPEQPSSTVQESHDPGREAQQEPKNPEQSPLLANSGMWRSVTRSGQSSGQSPARNSPGKCAAERHLQHRSQVPQNVICGTRRSLTKKKDLRFRPAASQHNWKLLEHWRFHHMPHFFIVFSFFLLNC